MDKESREDTRRSACNHFYAYMYAMDVDEGSTYTTYMAVCKGALDSNLGAEYLKMYKSKFGIVENPVKLFLRNSEFKKINKAKLTI